MTLCLLLSILKRMKISRYVSIPSENCYVHHLYMLSDCDPDTKALYRLYKWAVMMTYIQLYL